MPYPSNSNPIDINSIDGIHNSHNPDGTSNRYKINNFTGINKPNGIKINPNNDINHCLLQSFITGFYTKLHHDSLLYKFSSC